MGQEPAQHQRQGKTIRECYRLQQRRIPQGWRSPNDHRRWAHSGLDDRASERSCFMVHRSWGVKSINHHKQRSPRRSYPAGLFFFAPWAGCIFFPGREQIIPRQGTTTLLRPERPSGRAWRPIRPSLISNFWQFWQMTVSEIGRSCWTREICLLPHIYI